MIELFFAKLFSNSVDRLVAGLDKLEAKLQQLATRLLDEALKDDGVAARAKAAAEEKREEALRALRIASRVHGLKE